jgi:hypothetical protein
MEIVTNSGTPAFFGRTLYDERLEGTFFNWTASGFTLRFLGDKLTMDATAFADTFPGEGKSLPWLSVLVDGDHGPARLIPLEEGRKRYLLFEADDAREYTLTVIKRSEASKGRACVHSLSLQGVVLPYTPPQPRYRLEFVGDSITCGFGNAMDAAAPVFTTELEDGLKAYPAIASNILGAQYQSVCISGIPLCPPLDPANRIRLPQFPDFSPPPLAMETQYAFADRYHQEKTGVAEPFTLWDFGRFRPDAIVVNLGTNDAFRMSVTNGGLREERHFQDRYTAFLHTLRSCNGEKPLIACTLGPMNYYLFDVIEKAVAVYRAETDDRRVFTLKFGAIDPFHEGFGGLGHPNMLTHERMGLELAQALLERLTKE